MEDGSTEGPQPPRKSSHTDLALIIFNQDLAGLHFFDDAPNGNICFVGRGGVQPHMVTLEGKEKTVVRPLFHFPFLLQIYFSWGLFL